MPISSPQRNVSFPHPLRSMPLNSPQRNVSFPRSPNRSMPLSSPQRNVSFPRSPQKHTPQFTSKKRLFPLFPSEACPSVHLKKRQFPSSPQKHAPQFTSKKRQFPSFPSLKNTPQFTSKKRQFPKFPSEACPSVHLKETSVSVVPLRSMPHFSPQRNISFPRSPQKHASQFTSKKRQFPSFPSEACP